MAPHRRGFVALTIVIAMLSLAGPSTLAWLFVAHETDVPSAFSAESASAELIDSETGELPRREQTMLRLAGVVTALEEDDSDSIGDDYHFVVVGAPTFEPTRRPPVTELADAIRLVIARGWRALPCERGPPAA